MYQDYYLSFKSKEEALQIFSTIPEHTYVSEEGELKITEQTSTFSLFEVGTLYKNDAKFQTNENGEITIISPPTQIPGHHYNYRLVWGQGEEIPLPEVLEQYLKTPKHPQTVIF